MNDQQHKYVPQVKVHFVACMVIPWFLYDTQSL